MLDKPSNAWFMSVLRFFDVFAAVTDRLRTASRCCILEDDEWSAEGRLLLRLSVEGTSVPSLS